LAILSVKRKKGQDSRETRILVEELVKKQLKGESPSKLAEPPGFQPNESELILELRRLEILMCTLFPLK
jgi:hypothetical protein